MISKDYLKNILVFLTPIFLGHSIGASISYNNSWSYLIYYIISIIYYFIVLLYINYKYHTKKTFNLSVVLMILSIAITIIIYFIKPERFTVGGQQSSDGVSTHGLRHHLLYTEERCDPLAIDEHACVLQGDVLFGISEVLTNETPGGVRKRPIMLATEDDDHVSLNLNLPAAGEPYSPPRRR
jgi:hypothetical protein